MAAVGGVSNTSVDRRGCWWWEGPDLQLAVVNAAYRNGVRMLHAQVVAGLLAVLGRCATKSVIMLELRAASCCKTGVVASLRMGEGY